MPDRKIIAIIGATGAQGGGLVRAFGFPGAEDLGNMFQFKCEFQEVFCGPRDPKVARPLNPALLTFDAWLAANKTRNPIE